MIQSLLRHTVTRVRYTTIYDKGRVTQRVPSETSVICLVQPRLEDRKVIVKGQEVDANYVMYCNMDADVQVGDTIVHQGIQYEIVGVLDEAGQSDHYKVLLRSPDYGERAGSGS